MFNQLLRLLQTPEPARAFDPRLSVAVLLLEAARQDDCFDDRERATIARLLADKYVLSADECGQLLAAAEAQSARMVQLHGHTSEILSHMSPQERVELIEMLWRVAYADGVLDPEEDLLIRRVAGLIQVSDRERVLARQRVLTDGK